jgi:uracil-DNA glycosylase
MPARSTRLQQLRTHTDAIRACRDCPGMVGPPVACAPILSTVMVIGQAPGPHEAEIGRPFAWTAGKTLFAWLTTIGLDEAEVRRRIYFAAVCRCFPGKDPKGSDRVPDADEIESCAHHIATEIALLQPQLVLAVGKLAIAQLLPDARQLADVVGTQHRLVFHGRELDVIPLPHPSGASTWHRMEPGKTLLARALARVAAHPAWQAHVAAAAPRPATGLAAPPRRRSRRGPHPAEPIRTARNARRRRTTKELRP